MVLEVSFGLGCAAFLILIALTLFNRRPAGIGIFAIAVFAATALWAFAEANQVWWEAGPGVAHALGSFRSWIWLQFIASVLIVAQKRSGHGSVTLYRIIIPALGIFVVGNDLRLMLDTASPVDLTLSQVYDRVIIAIVGLLLVENLFRNTRSSRRWHMFPLCLAAGSLFAYDLFVFADALITRSVDITLLAARGVLLVLIVPLLIVTMVRNEDWRIDIHVSRRVVFHTATLTAGGIFLVAAGGAASLLGQIQGDWGSLLKITFFCGSVLVLATVVSTESLRSRAWRLIGENFFSRRYDYREEWLRFVETLSSADDLDPLQIRVIRAVANIVDSPAGVLWLEDRDAYRIANSYNMTLEGAQPEPLDSPFVAAFKEGSTVLDIRTLVAQGAALPDWAAAGPPIWLAVPLTQLGEILGFILLAPPRAPLTLNWESFDLLRTSGRQVASYLMEERATRALVDGKSLIEYNKKFAFIVHDVKNLSSQLGMMVSNIRRYSDRPEFRADMIRTLENSVGRLNGLLNKLRSDGGTVRLREIMDPVPVIKTVIGELAHGAVPIQMDLPETNVRVRMEVQELHSVLTHLMTNAIEASCAGEAVKVRLKANDSRVVIDVEDKGPGMDTAFVRNELFTPLRSTKSRGHGIGAFQARETIRAAGGDLEVLSVAGQGTIMRIIVPNAAPPVSSVSPVSQKVAPA
jgi:putative PEP-CTERM system histidine kinase